MLRTQTLLIATLASFAIRAQNTFEITIPVPDLANAAGGCALPDGGFAFGGELSDGLVVIRTDSTGAVLWTRTLSEGGNDEGIYDNSFAVADDRIHIGGYAMGPNTASRDGILHILDLNGNVLHQRLIDVGFDSNAIHGLTVAGNDVLVAGRRAGAGSYDMLLQRMDSVGLVTGSWSYGTTGWDWAYEAIRCTDGGMALVGYGDDVGGPAPSAYLVRTDSLGQELWARGIDGASADEGYCVLEDTSSASFFVGGRTLGMGTPGTRGFITRFDASGGHVWTRVIGNAFDPIGIVPTGLGHYLALLRAENIAGGHGEYDALLLEFDIQGTLIGGTCFGTADDEYPISLERTPGGGLLITCLRAVPGDNGIYSILLDSTGSGACTGVPVSIAWSIHTPTIIVLTSTPGNGHNPSLWPTGTGTPSLTREFACCTYPVEASFTAQATGDPLTWDLTSTSTGVGDLTWTIGGASFAGPTLQYTFASAGVYEVCLEIEGICATDTACQILNVGINGLDDLSVNARLRMWPQPATDLLHITSDLSLRSVEILDGTGRMVRSHPANGDHALDVDVRPLPPGAYQLRALTDAGVLRRAWIKQ